MSGLSVRDYTDLANSIVGMPARTSGMSSPIVRAHSRTLPWVVSRTSMRGTLGYFAVDLALSFFYVVLIPMVS